MKERARVARRRLISGTLEEWHASAFEHALRQFDEAARRLRLSVSAAPGTPVRYTLYSEAPVKAVTNDRGQAVAFTWSRDTRLAHLTVLHEEGYRIDISF